MTSGMTPLIELPPGTVIRSLHCVEGLLFVNAELPRKPSRLARLLSRLSPRKWRSALLTDWKAGRTW